MQKDSKVLTTTHSKPNSNTFFLNDPTWKDACVQTFTQKQINPYDLVEVWRAGEIVYRVNMG